MRKKLTAIVVVTLLFFVGCTDDFVETTEAQGVLSEENLTDENGNFTRQSIETFLVNVYANLYGNNVGDPWLGTADNWWFDVITDDSHKGSNAGDQPDLELMKNFSYLTSNPYFLVKWQTLISGSVAANDVLAKASAVEEVEDLIAEARFLRAHFNFELQRSWDKVPFISEEDSTANIANEGAIWDEIEADLEYAVDNLPDLMTAGAVRASRLVAQAYLGKVLIQQGKYSEAIPHFTSVINSGQYALATEFEDNFKSTTENGPESVFAIQFTSQDGAAGTENGNLGGTLNNPAGGPYGSCCGFYQPTQDLVNLFKTDANGLPLFDTYNDTDVTNDNRVLSTEAFTLYTGSVDPRLDYTVGRRGVDYNGWGLHPGSDWIGDGGDGLPWSSGPYLPKKNTYKDSDFGDAQGSGPWGQQSSGLNYNVIRYADVLLMAAEAEAQVGSLINALDYVNQVRNRAKSMSYVPGSTNYIVEPYTSFPSTEYAVQAVRYERRLELAMEGHRFFDLKRYGSTYAINIMTEFEVNESRTLPDYDPGPMDQRHLTLPVPTGAIDISSNVLTQNDAWN